MEILNADEVATLLQVPRNKIVLMAKAGEIPAYVLLGKLRFDADELAAWIKKLRVLPGDPVSGEGH